MEVKINDIEKVIDRIEKQIVMTPDKEERLLWMKKEQVFLNKFIKLMKMFEFYSNPNF